MAAFAFSRMQFPGKPLLFLFALGTLMIPGDVLLIPNFITIQQFGWVNSYQALIVPFIASGFGIFLSCVPLSSSRRPPSSTGPAPHSSCSAS